jgi:hypothetical protein
MKRNTGAASTHILAILRPLSELNSPSSHTSGVVNVHNPFRLTRKQAIATRPISVTGILRPCIKIGALAETRNARTRPYIMEFAPE